MSVSDPYVAPSSEFVRSAFDSISPRYDLLNQILSFGMADRWRKKACEIVLGTGSFSFAKKRRTNASSGAERKSAGPPLSTVSKGDRHHFSEGKMEPVPFSILDLGCGTGKFLECFLKAQRWRQAVGIDLSSGMIGKARASVPGNAVWLQRDFETIPFPESSFDLAISAFTLRSVQDLPRFFSEVRRVLVPGGRAGFLELTRPRRLWQKVLFFPYLRILLPIVGRLVGGNESAYRFLANSVERFPEIEKVLEMMRRAGFAELRMKSFSFGTATLIIAKK